MSLPTPLRRIATGSRHLLRRKLRQTNRLSRKSLPMALLLGGAALVALVSLGFAYLADLALEWNREWVGRAGWLALVVLPCALAALRWATLRFAPNAAGSGAVLARVVDFLHTQGCEVTLEHDTAQHVGALGDRVLDVEGIGRHCQLALVVGGDGTMLGIGRRLGPWGVPLIGINQGRLGSVSPRSHQKQCR